MPPVHEAKTRTVEPTKMTLRYALVLIAASTLALLGAGAYLLATGHSLIMKPDGLALYYTYGAYEGDLVRNAVSSLLSGVVPAIPQYTFDLGYGADVLGTMSGSINNPLNLIYGLVPHELTEYAYYFSIWLRIELVAFAFSLYCFNRGKDPVPTLVGAICYLTCGFMIFWGMLRHPGFMVMAAFLPMFFMGADKIFDGGKSTLLVVMVALSFFNSVYFTYMLCFFLLGYCLIKYFFAPRNRSIGDFAKLVARFAVCLLIGFAIGALCGYPIILQMTSMGRVTQSIGIPLFYSPVYYIALPAAVTGTFIMKRSLYLGAISLLVIAVFLFCGKRFDATERKPWLVGLLVVTVMACIPWFGHMLNGFGYVSDRWMALLGFCVGYIACLTVPVLGKLEKREWAPLGALVIVIVVIGLAASVVRGSLGAVPMAVVSIVLVCLVAVLYFKGTRAATAMLCCSFIICGSCAAAVFCSPEGRGYEDSFGVFGDAYATEYETSAARAGANAGGDGQQRLSMANVAMSQSNSGILLGEKTLSIFSSFYSQPIDDFRNDLGISSNHVNFIYGGNDGRLALDALSGARYFAATKAQTQLVPYSYEKTSAAAGPFTVYESDAALPIAFTYGNTIAKSSFDEMSTVERQEALLAGCVLADAEADAGAIEPALHVQKEPVDISASSGIIVEDGSFTVSSGDETVTLTFEGAANSEMYLCFDNLMFEGLTDTDAARAVGAKADSGPKALLADMLYEQPGEFVITAKTDGFTKKTEIDTLASNKWVGRVDWAINFGHFEQTPKTITLQFSEPGVYTFDSVHMEYQSVEPVMDALAALGENAASNVGFGTDSVKACFNASESGNYAFFSLPYSKGWNATVDGKPASIVRADVGFMAIQMDEPGEHEVALTYRTPGLQLGAVASCCGIVAFIALLIVERTVLNRRRKRHVHNGA